jgi:hypothetical protein
MLMSTAQYQATLPYPHKRHTTMQVYQEGIQVANISDLTFSAGNVTASLTSRVTRTASLTFSDVDFPGDVNAILSPYASVLQINTGIQYSNGLFEVFPVFRGRVAEPQRGPDGTVTVRADDRAADVIAFRFEAPENTVTGATVLEEIQRMILAAVPEATFGTNNVTDQDVPALTWDEDRGQALDDLAAVVQGRWYELGNGDFVVRRYPYSLGTVVATLSDGPAGLVSEATRTLTRDGVVNSVTVVAERIDGTDPIRVTARNTDPLSPTRFGDRYGRVSLVLKIQTPLTSSAAQLLAVQQLSTSSALSEQWSVSMVPDATLEPGDTISVSYRGQSAEQVIDSITYPLTTDGLMSLSTRSAVAEPVVIATEDDS